MANIKKPKRILIAEDEKLMAKALSDQLLRAGFAVEVVYDGESALDFLNKEKFDLVLLDILMPKMNGLDVLKELKSKGDQTPVVILSNSSKEETIKEAKGLGAIEYFVKSNVSLSEVTATAKKILL